MDILKKYGKKIAGPKIFGPKMILSQKNFQTTQILVQKNLGPSIPRPEISLLSLRSITKPLRFTIFLDGWAAVLN